MRLLGAVALTVGLASAGCASAGPLLLVMEPEIEGDTGPEGPAAYDERLSLLESVIAGSIEDRGFYDIADSGLAESSFAKHRRRRNVHGCVPCAIESAAEARADRTLSVWVYRMSNLVLSMQAVLRDADTGAVRYSTAHDFRGDTDEAWIRAATRLVRGMEEDIPADLR